MPSPRHVLAVLSAMLLAVGAYTQASLSVREISVQGNSAVSTDAITAAMRLKPGSQINPRDLLEDEQAIRALGFFQDVKLFSTVVNESQSDIIVQVSEFPIIREVRISGNTAVPSEELTNIVTAQQPLGRVWNLRNVQPITQRVAELYEQRGLFAAVERLGPAADSPGVLELSLIEQRVDDIRLVGLDRTRPEVIRRIMRTKPGGLLSSRTLRRDIEELYATYWFEPSGVRVAEPEPTQEPGVYDLTIEFDEARTGQINAGVALDPQSRIVGTLSYSDSNFLGRGQSVGLQLSQGTTGGGPSAELSFGNRFYDSRDTTVTASVFSRVVYNFTGSGVDPIGGGGADERFDERRTGASVTFSRPVGNYRASLGTRAQNVKTIRVGDRTEEFIQQDGNLLTLSLGLSYDVRRPSVDPYTGWLATMLIEPGLSDVNKIGGNVAQFTNILGQNLFVRTTFECRQYLSAKRPEDTPPDALRPVAAFRARYSRVWGDVPFFEQVFIGGSDSLRGYQNQRFWGKQSFLASVEYRQPIQRALSLIAFVDYGGAWGGYGVIKDFEQTQGADLRLAYGLGLAFRVPSLGSIRIDFAINQEGQNRTHFSFGPSF